VRFLFTIQYLGTRYAGWQSQTNAVGIQQVIEAALANVCGTPVRVSGAGRTDSGVHASAQQAHADIPIRIDERGIVLAVNTRLPGDIRIVEARRVEADFHCRFEPHEKTYEYRIWSGSVANVFRAPTHAHVPQALDVDRMARAVEPLKGRHDFRAFTVADPEVSSTWRTIRDASVAITADASVSDVGGRAMAIRVSADGFLRFMVRRIAGSLIEIGSGRLDIDGIEAALEPHYGEARWTAPPEGLTLVEVTYDRA